MLLKPACFCIDLIDYTSQQQKKASHAKKQLTSQN